MMLLKTQQSLANNETQKNLSLNICLLLKKISKRIFPSLWRLTERTLKCKAFSGKHRDTAFYVYLQLHCCNQ